MMDQRCPKKKPDSVIGVSLETQEDSNNVGLIAAIAAPLGVIGLAALVALFFWGYRTGQRS